MLENGLGLKQDFQAAMRCYKLSAEKKHSSAQFNIGSMYEQHHGVEQDDIEAINWYKLAASQGHEEAHYRIGYLYLIGQSVKQDYQEAKYWLELSAQKGTSIHRSNLEKFTTRAWASKKVFPKLSNGSNWRLLMAIQKLKQKWVLSTEMLMGLNSISTNLFGGTSWQPSKIFQLHWQT